MNTNRDLTTVKGYIYKITSPLGDVYIDQIVSLKDIILFGNIFNFIYI